ncbi:hypothetical protein EMCG_06286 [[Emmonsia] crescens]|uniref:Uncharacterized protein n=1 Tax=[Emmonsia] crescens TaxID=73230 RepID=A0A0G2J6Z8_9EURO|nr:hypothetical protein EMCG_06286 [Emmonsia crescens UAMH 3008]
MSEIGQRGTPEKVTIIHGLGQIKDMSNFEKLLLGVADFTSQFLRKWLHYPDDGDVEAFNTL